MKQCWLIVYETFGNTFQWNYILEFYHLHSRKCTWNCRLSKWRPFCPGREEINWYTWNNFFRNSVFFVVVVITCIHLSLSGFFLHLMIETISNATHLRNHDDVIKWKHFPRCWPFVRGFHRSLVNSPHIGQWHGTALTFSFICAWINGGVNTHEAGVIWEASALIMTSLYWLYNLTRLC